MAIDNMRRYAVMACIMALATPMLLAQRLQGHVGPASEGMWLYLKQAKGADMLPFDSTRVSKSGDFRFQDPVQATGFYQLVLGDSDRVNIILDKREPLVDLRFKATPLAQNMVVASSEENKRLQEFELVVKEAQAIQASVREQKARLQPSDTLQLAALDRVLEKAYTAQESYLKELAQDSARSYFVATFLADRAVQRALGQSPMAVAAVFNFSDPQLMRSAAYDQAIMAFFQNLRSSKESQFVMASDTLIALAGKDPQTKAYMLEHLIDLFATYGPEMALQHVVDSYVVKGDAVQLGAAAREKIERLLAVSVGRTAPDALLQGLQGTAQLSALTSIAKYTALFFYSSTCEHCHAQLPGLKQDLERYGSSGFQVVGIALDADTTEYLDNIRENGITWATYSEFNGWGSSVAKAFEVKGTPSFFLLDRQRLIVAKPRDAAELGKKLGSLLAR